MIHDDEVNEADLPDPHVIDGMGSLPLPQFAPCLTQFVDDDRVFFAIRWQGVTVYVVSLTANPQSQFRRQDAEGPSEATPFLILCHELRKGVAPDEPSTCSRQNGTAGGSQAPKFVELWESLPSRTRTEGRMECKSWIGKTSEPND